MNKLLERTMPCVNSAASAVWEKVELLGIQLCNLGYNIIHLQNHRDRYDRRHHPSSHKGWGMRSAEVVLALAMSSEAVGGDLNLPPHEEEYAPDHFIATFEPWADKSVREDLHRTHGTEALYQSPYGFSLVKVPEGESPVELARKFASALAVRAAMPDYKAYAFGPATDAYFHHQWNLDKIRAGEAWEITTGDTTVTVAVLDTGVHPAAEDLANTSFSSGRDFTDGDDQPVDLNGHGTHVTGIIAQSTNNGIGTAGIAHGVTVMPVKVLDDNGVGLTSRIMEGVYFAATNGADVINLSFGYPAALGDPGQPLHEAVSYAASKGVTLVAAAGNEGYMTSISYPAAYPECIAVGATRFDDQVTSYSNKGVALELVAPGGDLTVDQNRDGFPDGILQESLSERTFGYYYAQGTSMAAPHVSATAALLISLGVIDPNRVREILRDTARDLGEPGFDQQSGYGLIDARRAAEEACKLAAKRSAAVPFGIPCCNG